MNLSVYLFYQRDVWRLFFSRNVFYFLFWLVQFVTSPLFPAAQLAMLSAHLWNISQVRNSRVPYVARLTFDRGLNLFSFLHLLDWNQKCYGSVAREGSRLC